MHSGIVSDSLRMTYLKPDIKKVSQLELGEKGMCVLLAQQDISLRTSMAEYRKQESITKIDF